MEKIKQLIISSAESSRGKDVLAVFIIILVGVGSFGLGRLSNGGTKTEISVAEYSLANTVSAVVDQALSEPKGISTLSAQNEQSDSANKIADNIPSKKIAKNFFASSRGSKYYHPGCTGGKTLKEENKIWFATKEEAETAGYELSTSCK